MQFINLEKNYIEDIKARYSDIKGRKGLTNFQLAEKYFGENNKAKNLTPKLGKNPFFMQSI